MSDFFEVDFLAVGEAKSGDAIAVRYSINGETRVHVVDGGYQEIGAKVVEHIEKYYDNPERIDHVVVTHPDGDHARGLVTVIESKKVSALWMLRPWLYADELIHRFSKFSNKENLIKRLKEAYPNLALVEEAATRHGVPIYEPFQGQKIGAFTVLAPTKARWIELIIEDEKTPEPAAEFGDQQSGIFKVLAEAVRFIKALWGEENFSGNETSSRNEMSVVQFASICGQAIVLTGDAGRAGLREAADYAPAAGLSLPGVERFQVPHHGSRRNLSSELLDEWLGERFSAQTEDWKGTAIISAGKDDDHHPRKVVLRALYHRGWKPCATKGKDLRTQFNAPARDNWVSADIIPYPHDQEE